jgi:hypothetical protein
MAACEEGVGAPEFRQMVLEAGTDTEFLRRIANIPATIDQWQLEKLALTTARQSVSWYVPGVPPEYQDKLWGRSYATAQSAVTEVMAGLAPGASVAVIPDGPYVLAKAAGAS